MLLFFFIVSYEVKPPNAKQMHARVSKNIERIINVLHENSIEPLVSDDVIIQRFQWDELPKEINPSEGE